MNELEARPPQRALAAAVRCDPTLCPDADTLVAFADGTLAAEQRDRVAARVAECASCAMVVRVALDALPWADGLGDGLQRLLDAGSGKASGQGPDPHDQRQGSASGQGSGADGVVVGDFTRRTRVERRFKGPPVALAVAASGMLMVFAVVLLRTPPVEDTLRGAPMIAVAPLDGAVLRQVPASLRWPCAAAPTAANVEVLGADASPLWSGTAQECAVVLPESTRVALAPGQYLWRVRNAAGEPLLGPFAFRVEP